MVVGQDVLGGVFAWAQSGPEAAPTLHYFGPDTLEWQDLISAITENKPYNEVPRAVRPTKIDDDFGNR